MKNQILGIIALGVLGACNSEQKDEVGRYVLVGYHMNDEQYSIFDTKTGMIVDYKWDNNSIQETREIGINGKIKITNYNEEDTSYTNQFNLSFDKYKLYTPGNEQNTEQPVDSAAFVDTAATSDSERAIESQMARKELYRNLLNDPATMRETRKYSFISWEKKFLSDKKAVEKLATFSVEKNWALDREDFLIRYAPELGN